jgi:hypothetical protein
VPEVKASFEQLKLLRPTIGTLPITFFGTKKI